jgi:pimeloyl-ACP methyl ester carboxylesterase
VNEGPQRRSVLCAGPSGLHRVSYLEWGERTNPQVALCVHGLTRCGRDFDVLAQEISHDYRVIAPDLPGRGDSDWLPDPMQYVVPMYLADMVTLIARLDVAEVHWIGTSLGGTVGMVLASLVHSPVRSLVLNDVGPLMAAGAIERIAAFVGKGPDFETLDAAVKYVRFVSASFGPHSDEQWRSLTENMLRPRPAGGFRLHYDPAIAAAFAAQATGSDIDLWPMYDAIRCPTLLLRGAVSDLVSRETAQAMRQRGPKAQVMEFAGVGHAPTLIQDDQVGAVREFLQRH